jgi:amino-acid N-acetyltransferase
MTPSLPVLQQLARRHLDVAGATDEQARRSLEQAREARRVAIVPDVGLYMRRAEPGDARELHELLERFVAPGLLIPRTLKQVYSTIRDFVVVVEDGRIVGCGALRIYSAELGEIGALAVLEEKRDAGLGGRIVDTLVHDARNLGLRRVIALTMRDRFFHRHGFVTKSLVDYPEKIAADCVSCTRRAGCQEIAVSIEL